MKLYRSTKYPTRWYAFQAGVGWCMFPAEPGGWDKRQPARGIDPIDVREVPLRLAFSTGVPEAGGSDQRLPEAA